jgi:diaminopimelate epimerase
MTDELHFTKMVASGNDFIVIDNRLPGGATRGRPLSGLAKSLCGRAHGVGADGLLAIEPSKKADFKMRIFNSDGSEADMCGNGARCAALYAVENNIAPKNMKIDTRAGVISAEVTGLRVKIRLTDPRDISLDRKIKIGRRVYRLHSINTGVPHAVIFAKRVDKINVNSIGPRIRFHRVFKPAGTNVDFVEIVNMKEIKVRTYERGVEAETAACGTGSAASAVIASLISGLSPHIDAVTSGGEVLRVYFEEKNGKIRNLYLEGEAKMVFHGRTIYV